MTRTARFSGNVVVALLIAACGDFGSANPSVRTVEFHGIGVKASVAYTPTAVYGIPYESSATPPRWHASNDSVVEVQATVPGELTLRALHPGGALVRAEGLKGSVSVQVAPETCQEGLLAPNAVLAGWIGSECGTNKKIAMIPEFGDVVRLHAQFSVELVPLAPFEIQTGFGWDEDWKNRSTTRFTFVKSPEETAARFGMYRTAARLEYQLQMTSAQRLDCADPVVVYAAVGVSLDESQPNPCPGVKLGLSQPLLREIRFNIEPDRTVSILLRPTDGTCLWLHSGPADDNFTLPLPAGEPICANELSTEVHSTKTAGLKAAVKVLGAPNVGRWGYHLEIHDVSK